MKLASRIGRVGRRRGLRHRRRHVLLRHPSSSRISWRRVKYETGRDHIRTLGVVFEDHFSGARVDVRDGVVERAVSPSLIDFDDHIDCRYDLGPDRRRRPPSFAMDPSENNFIRRSTTSAEGEWRARPRHLSRSRPSGPRRSWRGETYVGPATLSGSDYVTVYHPTRPMHRAGAVNGILFTFFSINYRPPFPFSLSFLSILLSSSSHLPPSFTLLLFFYFFPFLFFLFTLFSSHYFILPLSHYPSFPSCSFPPFSSLLSSSLTLPLFLPFSSSFSLSSFTSFPHLSLSLPFHPLIFYFSPHSLLSSPTLLFLLFPYDPLLNHSPLVCFFLFLSCMSEPLLAASRRDA